MTNDISLAFQTLSGVYVDTGLDMVRQPSAYLDLLRKFVGKYRRLPYGSWCCSTPAGMTTRTICRTS